MLAGRNDVAPLNYYAGNMKDYSDDGKTLNGAYGYRWRHESVRDYVIDRPGHYTMFNKDCDQLNILVDHLKADPTSRRAVLAMWNVEDDLLKVDSSKDVCCNLNVMFSLREETVKGEPDEIWPWKRFLDMTVTNRSNDMIWGMLGANYVHFTFLQEYMAARLGVEVGVYHHFTNNLHVYESNWKPEEWLADQEQMSYKPNTDCQKLVVNVADFERELLSVVGNGYGKGIIGTLDSARFKEPFFTDVAIPMIHTFSSHKDRDYELALKYCGCITSEDWRIAATNWIKKRQANYLKKGAVKDE